MAVASSELAGAWGSVWQDAYSIGERARLRSVGGSEIPLDTARWIGEPPSEERAVLEMAVGPVLDIGCGPARHTLDLARRGVEVLGVDEAPASVRLAEQRGASVLHRSVFDPLPNEGSWGSALLLDGNIGIGGDPVRLLRRVRSLLRPGGLVLIEVDTPEVGSERMQVRVEARGASSAWFAWARVSAADVPELASDSGFARFDRWQGGVRWFARLEAR